MMSEHLKQAQTLLKLAEREMEAAFKLEYNETLETALIRLTDEVMHGVNVALAEYNAPVAVTKSEYRAYQRHLDRKA